MSRHNDRADEIDRHVGLRIRELRQSLGISQMELAATIDVTYQQMHKYEKGTNRISAGRLALLAMAFNMPIGYFFEGVRESGPLLSDGVDQRLLLELAKYFKLIKKPRHQEAVHFMIRALAENS